MSKTLNKLGITDVVLRDAQQSLFATRLRIDDMLPIAGKLDQVGYWSLETWGGATFDSCVRYLGEDPWDRIRELKKSMPNTPQQMLFRGQNILGYRHYADDVVIKFVERAAHNGVDVFRVFDAMNDMRNLRTALSAVKAVGKHAQGTISYTMSPVHNMDMWIDLGRQLEDMGANSIAIKDMAGLLKPYDGYHLVKKLKAAVDIPIHMHSHATTGLSTATALKCIEAGIDNIDTAISSMSMTYGHSPTEAIVAMLDNTERDTGLDLNLLEEIADYFRGVRKKYAKFEGSLRGVDSRILVAQVPGGMLTNMENQLKEQGAIDRFDDVLAEIPRVREDLGYLPLVTPTSQIVGSQSVLNVLSGERYKTITKETRAVLKGEYGVTPSEVNKELQMKVLEEGMEPVTCRPADLLAPELDALTSELELQTKEKSLTLAVGENRIDDVLTYALFPHIGLKFLENRGNPDAFEPIPSAHASPVRAEENNEERTYTVTVEGVSYIVAVSNGGDVLGYTPVEGSGQVLATSSKRPGIPEPVPLAGNIFSVLVIEGQTVEEGQAIVVLEAMKMETEVCATRAGIVSRISVKEGDAVVVGDCLLEIS